MRKIFHIYALEEQAVVSVTRNADLSYDVEKFDEDNPDFRTHISKLLRQRDRLAPVRLEMQGDAPALRKQLLERLNLSEQQCYTCSLSLIHISHATGRRGAAFRPKARAPADRRSRRGPQHSARPAPARWKSRA